MAITAGAGIFIASASAHAATDTWVGSGANATWSTSANWSGGVPGATTGTANTDTALFNAAAPALGTGVNPVLIDAGRNIQNITFDTNAGAYIIGTTGGSALTLTSGGTIQDATTMTSGKIETVNAPLVIAGSGTTTVGSYTMANNAAALSSGLVIGGSVDAAAGTTATFTLGGTNTGANNILSGLIGSGSGSGLGTITAISKTGAGTWDVTGNNTGYSGTTTISGGTLSMGNANALGTGTITIAGGTLAADTAVALSNNISALNSNTFFDSVGGSHSISTSGNLIVTSTTGTPAVFINSMTGGASFSVTGSTYLANSTSNIGEVIFGGAGNTSLDTIYGGPIGNSTIASQIFYYGTGTLTLNGTDNATGIENFLGGTVVVNENGDGVGTILGAGTNFLTLGSNLVLSGGSGNVENLSGIGVAGSGTLSYQANITASPGSGNTINIGTLGLDSGISTASFQPGVAFTTTGSGAVGTTNVGNTGIYGGWAIASNAVNSADFATNLSNTTANSAIIGLPTYLYSSFGRNTAYTGLIANGSGVTGADGGDGNFLNLKFDASNGTAPGAYNFTRSNVLMDADGGSNSLLFTGFANYTLGGNAMVGNFSTSSASTGITYLQQYGTGTLTVSNNLYGNGYFVAATNGGSATPLNGNVAEAYTTGTAFGALVKSGPGTVVLTGVNNYIGNTYINQGTLSISTDSNLGGISGSLTVTAATTASTTVTVTGVPVYQSLIGASFLGTTITGQSVSTTPGVAGGTVTLTLAAAKSATTGATSYANGQQILELNGGTLQDTGNVTLGESNGSGATAAANYRQITLGVNGGTIDVTGANTLVAPGVISQTTGGTGQLVDIASGVASLTKVDTGTLVLASQNTYTGGTNINGGTLKLDFNASTIANFTPATSNILAAGGGVSLGGGTLNISDAATAVVDTQTIASLALTGGSSTVSMTHNSATSSTLTVTNGAISRTAGSTVDFISPASTSIVLAGNNSNPFIGNYAFFGTGATEGYAATSSAGAVQAATTTVATSANGFTSATGNYSYAPSVAGTDVLSGNSTANTFTYAASGAQTIDLGTAGANTLTLNGFLNNGGALTIQRTGGTGTVAVGSANELVIGGASNVTISAPISGSGGALTDSNTGTLALSGVNTYTGPTTVNSGVLALTGGSLTGSKITTAGAGVVTQSSGNVIAGSGTTFTQASTGTSTLAGTNTYNGLTTVTNGELDLSNTTGQAVAGSVAVSGGTLKLTNANQIATTGSLAVSGGTFNVQTFGQTLAGVQLTGGTLSGTTGVLTSNSAFDIQAGVDSAILGGTNGLTKSTPGEALITSANTYTGTTTINAGALYISSLSNLGASTNAVVLGGGSLYYTGTGAIDTRGFNLTASSEIDSSAPGLGLIIGTANITGNSFTTTFGGTGNTTVNSNIATTSGGVTNNAFGTVTFAGTNSYTGVTTLNNGILNVGSTGALAGGGNITFNGGTLQYSSFNTIDYSSKIVGSTALGPILIDTNSQGVTFASALNNTNLGGLTKVGAGKLALTASNNYTGATTVSAGTLAISSDSNISSSNGTVSVLTAATNSKTVTLASTPSGNFGIGSTLLGSTVTAVSGTTVTLAANAAVAVSSTTSEGYVTEASLALNGGTLQANGTFGMSQTNATGYGATVNRGITLGGASTIEVTPGNTFTVAGVVSGGNALTKTNTGTLLLTGVNTYSGATTVNAGTFQVGNGTSGSLAAATGLTMGGGNFTLLGSSTAAGTTSQTVASVASTANTGSFITLNPNAETATGAEKLTITTGTLTTIGAGSALNFNYASGTTNGSTLGTAYATFGASVPTLTNSLIGGGVTVTDAGGTGFATLSGNNIVRLADPGSAGLPLTAGTATTNYFVNSSYGTTGTGTAGSLSEALTGSVVANSVSVDTTGLASGANLALGANTLTVTAGGGMVFTGANSYTITGTAGIKDSTAAGVLNFNNFVSGASTVTINAPISTATANPVVFAGTGTTILGGVNTYTGATSVDGGTLRLASTGSLSASSAVSVTSGATLAILSSKTLGALTIGTAGSSNGNVTLQDGAIDTLTTGALTINALGNGTSLSFDITSGTTGNLDKIAAAALTVNTNAGYTGGVTINIGNTTGTPTLSTGTYTLISDSNASPLTTAAFSAFTFANGASSLALDSATLTLLNTATGIQLVINGTAPTSTGYNLAATVANARVISGGSTVVTSTITNTGTAAANSDQLNYTALTAVTTGTGTLSASTLPKSATGVLVGNGTSSGSGTLAAGTTTGFQTITPTVGSATNTSLNSNAALGTVSTASLDVVANRVVTATSVNLGRVLVGHAVSGTSTLSTTGADANFTRVTVGTAGADGSGISATGGTPATVYNSASSTDTRTVGGTFTTAGNVSNTLTLPTTGEGLTGEAPIAVSVGYTADPVNLRVITNGASTNLGILHSGATVNTTSNPFTTSGSNSTTTSVTVAAGPGTTDANGIAISGAATSFTGTSTSDTRTLSGTITPNTTNTTSGLVGATTGSATLAVTTQETGLGDTYGNVNVAYTAQVYTGQSTWTTNGGGTWGSLTSGFGANWGANQGSPGLDSNFTHSDTATFGSAVTGTLTPAHVTLDVPAAGNNPSVKSVTFNDSNTSASYSIDQGTGSGSLVLNGTGSGAGTDGNSALITNSTGTNTITAPVSLPTNLVASVGSVSSVPQQLTISGPITGAGSLTTSGTGNMILSSTTGNGYLGGTTVGSTLYVNSGVSGSSSGTGVGAVSVSSTGILAGNGNITTSAGVTVASGGSIASGSLTQLTGSPAISPVGGLTFTDTAVTLNSANLTFNLGSGTTPGTIPNRTSASFTVPNNNTTYLTLSGSASINFAGTSSISLVDLTNGSLQMSQGVPYLLAVDTLGLNTAYGSLVTMTGSGVNAIYTIDGNGYVVGVAVGGYTGGTGVNGINSTNFTPITISEYSSGGVAPLNAINTYYDPVLYLNNGDLEVVPEPGTWALMLGGVALLVVIQRRRNKVGPFSS